MYHMIFWGDTFKWLSFKEVREEKEGCGEKVNLQKKPIFFHS